MLRIKVKQKLAPFTLEVNVECRYSVTAIYGPSGAGKSALLNLVGGLMRADEGEISVDDKVLFSSTRGIDLPPEKRGVGYVFQDDLLFPHLTVEGNLCFGQDLLAVNRRYLKRDQVIELLEIGPLLERRPADLSGGERQRVALGRALLTSPQLLLMDEPLASLDQGLKSRIIPYLRHIRADLGIPILYVSHSVAEILELTGQVLVMNRGRVVAHGDFFKIATHPDVLPLVEEQGFENVLPVKILPSERSPGDGGRSAGNAGGTSRVRCLPPADGGRDSDEAVTEQELTIPYCDRSAGSRLFIGIRADDVILGRHRPEGLSVRNALKGRIREISDVTGKDLVYVDVGRRLAAKVTPQAIAELDLKVGDTVYCLIKTHSIRLGPETD